MSSCSSALLGFVLVFSTAKSSFGLSGVQSQPFPSRNRPTQHRAANQADAALSGGKVALCLVFMRTHLFPHYPLSFHNLAHTLWGKTLAGWAVN